MTKVILVVTDEELKRLDSIGLFSTDMAGVLWQRVTITEKVGDESEGHTRETGS